MGNVRCQEPVTRSMQLHYISVTAFSETDLFLDRNSSGRLPWQYDDQSQETN